jgi:hypothetical protein
VTTDHEGKKPKINLQVMISSTTTAGLDLDSIESSFKDIAKNKGEGRKIKIQIHDTSTL